MARTSTSFAEGNLVALKHGARSPRFQAAKQQSIRARVRRELKRNARAWLDRLILALEARVSSYHEYITASGGPLGRNGQPRRCLEMCQRDEARLVQLYALREGRQPDASEVLAAILRGDQA